MKRVLVLDDHSSVREALVELLGSSLASPSWTSDRHGQVADAAACGEPQTVHQRGRDRPVSWPATSGVSVGSQARLREPGVLAAQVEALRAGPLDCGEFERGALAALRWLLDGGPGPVTGEVDRCSTDARTVVRELAAAEALIYGPGSGPVDYARGVEHALMWAQFATCRTPAGDAPGDAR
jgi:hypothetical protein